MGVGFRVEASSQDSCKKATGTVPKSVPAGGSTVGMCKWHIPIGSYPTGPYPFFGHLYITDPNPTLR